MLTFHCRAILVPNKNCLASWLWRDLWRNGTLLAFRGRRNVLSLGEVIGGKRRRDLFSLRGLRPPGSQCCIVLKSFQRHAVTAVASLKSFAFFRERFMTARQLNYLTTKWVAKGGKESRTDAFGQSKKYFEKQRTSTQLSFVLTSRATNSSKQYKPHCLPLVLEALIAQYIMRKSVLAVNTTSQNLCGLSSSSFFCFRLSDYSVTWTSIPILLQLRDKVEWLPLLLSRQWWRD